MADVHPNGVPLSPMDYQEIPIMPPPGTINFGTRLSDSTQIRPSQSTSISPPPRTAIDADRRLHTSTTATQSPATEKKDYLAQVRSFSATSDGTNAGLRADDEKPAWIPTWLRPLPLIGIGALILALCCLLASLAILIGSDSDPTDTWSWSPSVLLAISTAVCNYSIQFALAQALPIYWWFHASRGTTLTGLYRRWEAGQSIFGAILGLRHSTLLAVATIAATLIAIDGPLLQKATTVVSKTRTELATIQLQLAPELPNGFSGTYDENGIHDNSYMTNIYQAFMANSTISGNISGCQGKCQASVRGPGIAIQNCSTHSWPISAEMLHDPNVSWGSGLARDIAQQPIFTAQLYKSALREGFNGPEQMELLVGIANFTKCAGKYVEHTCTLVPAIMEFNIVSEGSVIELSTSYKTVTNATTNNTHVDLANAAGPLTFTPLGAFLGPQILANASFAPSIAGAISSTNLPQRNSLNAFAMKHALRSEMCESEFKDPTNNILSQFNNLMFRAGLVAAEPEHAKSAALRMDPGLNMTQVVQAEDTRTFNVFHSDLRWFAGAAVLDIVAILAVLPIFHGFWTLGTPVSMSPLQIAKAFGAPLLKHVNSAAGSRGIIRKSGDVQVRYGAVNDIDYDISMIEAGRVPSQAPRIVSRLAIVKAHNAVPPRRGQTFDR